MGEYQDNSTYIVNNIEKWAEELFGVGIFAMVIMYILVLFLIIAAVSLVMFFLKAIPLYRMAKKAGYKNAWLVWIPISLFQTFVCTDLPQKEFELFPGFFHMEKRRSVFWIYLAISLGSGLIAAVFELLGALTFGIGSFIGSLIAIVGSIVIYFLHWKIMQDLYDMYNPDNHGLNIAMSIIGLFVPLAAIIYFWVLQGKDPVLENQQNPTAYNGYYQQ